MRRVPDWLRWAAYAAIPAFCAYRLAVFTPSPLDAPDTLRPIIFDILDTFAGFFAHREDAFPVWSLISLASLFVPLALAAVNYRFPGRAIGSRWIFFASIAVCLLLCRFPTLLEPEFNPDEGQFLASADKLFYDANFFHAVDCGTSGPLNIYPLMLPAIVGFSPDFASSRVVVIVIIFLCAWLLYRSVALLAEERLARIAILPLVAAFAVFKNSELIHYSSEHLPLLLISLAMYLSIRVLREPAKYAGPAFLLGFLISAAFFAKMQSVPIVASEAGVAIACVYVTRSAANRWRPVLMLTAGALPLVLLNAILCAGAGVWHDFWMSYIRANSSYGEAQASFLPNLQGFIQYAISSNEVLFFACLVLAMGTLPLYATRLFRRVSPGADPVRWFGILTFVTLAATLISVYAPHHAFVHYLLLPFVPLSATIAWTLLEAPNRPASIALLLILVAAYQSYLWSFQDDHVFRAATQTIRPLEGDLIRSMTSAQGRIFVWGWTVRPYLGSGRVPATRDTNVSNCFRAYNLMTSPPIITPTPASREISEYYQNRILRDLRSNPPELFIDAIGPGSWFLTDRKYYGFEQFPAIAAFVRSHYLLRTTDYDQRYYLRRDLCQSERGSPR